MKTNDCKDKVTVSNKENDLSIQFESNLSLTEMVSPQGLEPIFLPGSNLESLLTNNVLVGISVLPRSPLLSLSGSFQLVSFLASLPKSSLIIIADSLNRHNIRVFHSKRKTLIPEDKALETALKAGDEYFDILSLAIKSLEPSKADKIKLLRWEDIEGDEMKTQQQIVKNYYEQDGTFKEKIGR